MDETSSTSLDENALTKGQRRKLTALRNSIGEEIGTKAFSEWLASQREAGSKKPDGNAMLITDTLWPMVQEGRLAIPRGGYLIRRGRGRIIVEHSKA